MSCEKNSTAGGSEILIVEDSPTQAMELKLILEKHGYGTSVASNGREALDWLSRNRPAMVISDIVMPKLDGYDLCRAIRKDARLECVPVILLSFLSNASDILKGLESGASNFIVKPYNPDFLISYIREELSGKGSKGVDLPQPLEIEYAGKEYLISSNIRQILDILFATYGTAVRKNEELLEAENELRLLNEHLEEKVRERTAALTAEIAERRRVEEELREKSKELMAYSAKLEWSNRELQDFAFIASHDLQEPLRKIRTFADRLHTGCYDSLGEKGRADLERMLKAARRMQDLIEDLLKYSRLASSTEQFTEIDLGSLVEEAIMNLEAPIKETQARIEVGGLPTIEVDAVQIRQLFQNLIANSIKYRGKEKPVVRVYVDKPTYSGFYEILVEDNGMGFDECYLDKVFRPFQRLHGRNAPYEGTGMGLAICRRIVERHGGSITARSKPGKGTVFVVRLPEKHEN